LTAIGHAPGGGLRLGSTPGRSPSPYFGITLNQSVGILLNRSIRDIQSLTTWPSLRY
jgi:hypothetical protein